MARRSGAHRVGAVALTRFGVSRGGFFQAEGPRFGSLPAGAVLAVLLILLPRLGHRLMSHRSHGPSRRSHRQCERHGADSVNVFHESLLGWTAELGLALPAVCAADQGTAG